MSAAIKSPALRRILFGRPPHGGYPQVGSARPDHRCAPVDRAAPVSDLGVAARVAQRMAERAEHAERDLEVTRATLNEVLADRDRDRAELVRVVDEVLATFEAFTAAGDRYHVAAIDAAQFDAFRARVDECRS